MMKCPQCKNIELKPSEIEPKLIVAECEACEGMLLPLIYYRYWLETSADESVTAQHEILSCDEPDGAKLCPKCNQIMLRFRISTDYRNRLDFCSSCDETWLDKDEWELLKRSGLHTQVASIITDVWQNKLRKQQSQINLDEEYRNKLGDEAFEELKKFTKWYLEQEKQTEIKQYLNMATH